VVTLAVNIDHVATVREARRGSEPDPVHAAVLAELAGARGIIVHLREDRRHIQDRDVHLLRQTVRSHFNLEMAATDEMVGIALKVKPDRATLVPERREELTTEGGLDVLGLRDSLLAAIRQLQEGGVLVSCFIDPEPDQVKAAARLGTDIVEIHTGAYANARDAEGEARELQRVQRAAQLAAKLDLTVVAGHGLDYHNVTPIAAIREIEELSIGHAIIGRALMVGMDKAVRDMRELIEVFA
jgi:pyridoxine 5-phosphate synthase